MQSHLPGIRVHRDVRRTAGLERIREESGTAAHVEHHRGAQWVEGIDLRRGISGQGTVEAVGVGLLDEEGSEQVYRSTPVGPMSCRVHRVTVPHTIPGTPANGRAFVIS